MRKGMMLLALVFLPSLLLAACTVQEKPVGGEPAVTLENDLVRVVVAPARGGQIADLVYKPTGKHLVAEETGLFVDRVWNYNDPAIYQQWEKTTYDVRTFPGDTEAAVELTGRGKGGPAERMIFHKRYTITGGSPAVRADYRFEVAQEAMAPMQIGLWFHGRPGVRGESNTYYLPSDGRVQEIAYGAGAKGEYWWYQPDRGWLAVRGESGDGLALCMDYQRLMSFYQWLHGDMPGLEFAYRSFEIKNGETLDTTIWLVPFTKLPTVTGASPEVVAAIDVKPEYPAGTAEVPYKITLSAPKPLEATLRLSLKSPDGTEQPLGDKPVSLPGTPTYEGTVRPAAAGTSVVRALIVKDGKTLLDCERPVTVGAATTYALQPLQPRLGREGERFADKLTTAGNAPPDLKPSEAIVTPHVPWGKPYYRGKTRALILNSFLTGREAVELAERFDLDYVAPTVGSSYEIGYTIGLLDREINLEQARGYVREALKRDYDVIVVGGMTGEFFSPDLLQTITEKVRKGTGLVWVQPNKLPAEFEALLPLTGFKPTNLPLQAWTTEVAPPEHAKQHYLTQGLPWRALPETSCSVYKPNGELLAATTGAKASDRRPLLAVREEGQGRIVCLGYNTSWQGPGSYSNGLTPWVRNAPQRFPYWEYHYSLLGKSLLWAARREPETVITSIVSLVDSMPRPAGEAPQRAVRVRIQDAEKARGLQATVRVTDEFGNVVDERTMPACPQGDVGGFTYAFPAHLAQQHHLVDVILRDQGKVVDWASEEIHLGNATVALSPLEKPVYGAGDVISTTVKASLLNGEGQAGSVELTLTDALGREIARQSSPLTVPKGFTQDSLAVDCQLTVPEPLTTKGTLRAEVRDAKGVLAAGEQDVLLMPQRAATRDWGAMTWTLWGNPAGAYSNDHMQAAASDQVRLLGMDTVQISTSWLQPEENASNFAAGFRLLPYGLGGDPLRLSTTKTRDGKPGFQEQQAEYVKTGDKQYLQRPVSLEDPELRQKQAEKIASTLKVLNPFRPMGYCLGDELSTTYYVTPYDYDFSPVSLQSFRTWLQTQYPDLAALNAEWETSFKSWDEVMPLTALEVKGRTNFAPWADHRTYMEYAFSDYMKFVRNEIRKHDPEGRIGISGTQAAEAYGGFDWWRLAHTLDFIQSYDHQNTGEMHRSFDMVTLPWWGYAQKHPDVSVTMWNRFFNQAHGGSFFVYNYMLNPDLTLPQATADGLAAIKDQQQGLGTLFAGCERPADVLVHYSQPSIHAAYITNADDLFRNNREGWMKAIDDLGMQTEFIAYAEIEAGALKNAKALILPYSQALSAKEVAAIKAFVQSGGVVIADGRPGLMDEHCRTLAQGALDDVFGVTAPKVDPLEKMVPGEAAFTLPNQTAFTLDDYVAQPSLQVKGGKALGSLGDAPLFIVNNYGKGKAILLNSFVNQYPRRRDLQLGKETLRIVQAAFAAGGIGSPIKSEIEGGGVIVRRFTDAGVQYVGLLRDAKPGGSAVRLTLPAKLHVYNARASKYLGATDRISLNLAAGEAAVYALLPAAVTSVKVQPKDLSVKQGQTLTYSVGTVPSGAPRAYRVKVLGPDNQERTYYATQLRSGKGLANGAITFALNDSPGAWTISATDVATGVTGQAKVNLTK
ncbi:MAG: beta-galactosidase trimerization domain-containing protein [Armatimonadia bacterium]